MGCNNINDCFDNNMNNNLNNNIINNINANNRINNYENSSFNNCNMDNSNHAVSKNKLMMLIREYSFSIVDLSEYLDTHPCDQKALMLHNEYSEKLKELKKKYEKEYGPLTIYSSQNSWKWIEGKWPWQKGGV